MSFSDRTGTNIDPRQIRPDYDVYSADGEDLGDVEEVREGYLVVKKGLIFQHEHYIPFSAITRIEPDSVYLNVTKDQIEEQGWDEMPPTQTGSRQATGPAGPAPMTGTERTEGERTVQLREEELRAQKRPVETGEVGLHKEVVSEQQTIDVPVTREEVIVERRPVDRQAADRSDAGEIGEGETLRVPVREERVTVEKTPVVTEEVTIGKRQVTDTERVSDTVRHEELRTEREGDVNVGGDWSRVSHDFRTNWQSRYGTSGRTWEQDEPSYRYGWESASDPRYRSREWADVESDLGRDWGARYGRHGTWDQAKPNAREAWEKARGRR